MSEHYFGVGRGLVSLRNQRRIETALKRADIDAGLVSTTIPGDGPRHWFWTWNRGEPFNSAAARRVDRVLRQMDPPVLDADGNLLTIGGRR